MTILEFLDELTDITEPGDFYMGGEGEIRSVDGKDPPSLCPITYLAYHKYGLALDNGEVGDGIPEMKLKSWMAANIMMAADSDTSFWESLRFQLIIACGLFA